MNPFKRLAEVIYTGYLKLKILGRLNAIEEVILEGFGNIQRRLNKMDQATQDAINAVKKAVTDGTADLAQTISNEATDIKTKFDEFIAKLPPSTDPEVVTQLNDFAGTVTNSFQSIKTSVQNLSDNIGGPSQPGSGETTIP